MEDQSNEGALNIRLSDSPEIDKVDRLSNLPDSLISHILFFVPTRDAIRTAILSKQWRHQWRWVSVLILDFSFSWDFVPLPEFLFGHALLTRLKIIGCTLLHIEKVDWKHLKELSANHCKFRDRVLENILCGSPILESLRLEKCRFHHIIVASKSLRKLDLVYLITFFDIGISCPNLEDLRFKTVYCGDYDYTLSDESIVSYGTIRLVNNGFVITSESLKKLVLEDLNIYDIEISCPVLEELVLLNGLSIRNQKAFNSPPLNSATLDFAWTSLIHDILPLLQHVKEIKFGDWFVRHLSPPPQAMKKTNLEDVFSCLGNLKSAQILFESDYNYNGVVVLVKALLKNARALEKLTVIIEVTRNDLVNKLSQKILSVPRCSKKATVDLYSKDQWWIKEVISKDISS